MLLARRPVVSSRFARRNLDPSAPLFVLRRIPAGVDGEGKPRVLLPGEAFDPKGIDARRLGFLYRNRFIDHERSRAHRQAVPQPPALDPAAPVAETPKPAPPAPAKPAATSAKPTGRRAGA